MKNIYEILYNRSLIKLSGQDAEGFLQKLTTNDIANNIYCYTYMLNNQGRYMFDFFCLKLPEREFLIDIAEGQARDFISRLSMYKLRSKVDIMDLSNKYKIAYSHSEKLVQNSLSVVSSNPDPRFVLLGYRHIVECTEVASDTSLLNSDNGLGGLYFQDKYNYAIPDGDIDLIQNKSIPLEYGAEELNAISYTKGCYIGQELISRTKYQGVVRKKIFKLIGSHNLDELKTEDIAINEETLGKICSSFGCLGIGLIKEDGLKSVGKESICIEKTSILLEKAPWYITTS